MLHQLRRIDSTNEQKIIEDLLLYQVYWDTNHTVVNKTEMILALMGFNIFGGEVAM